MPYKSRRKKKKLNPFRFIIFILVLIFLISSGAAIGFVAISIKDLPPFDEEKLITPTSTQIFDENEELVAAIGIENRELISINEVDEHVKNAILAAEDRSFYDHPGVSLKALVRAASNDALRLMGMNKNFQGGSTITIQLVKLIFLSDTAMERSLKRKIQEPILAFQMERRYSKDEILEMYMNTIYLGEGAHGIQAAAQTYFGIDASELTVDQAALLAGLIQSPNTSPFKNPEQVLKWRDKVLGDMYSYNYIDKETYQQAKAQKLALNADSPNRTQYPYPYFVDHIIEQLAEKYGDEKVYKGGLKVYTSLDTKIQTYAEKAMANSKNFPPPKDGEEPQGAIVIMDPANGEIKALVGGREHTSQRALNRATMSKRQPGSAIKPLLAYGPAVELLGMGPASVIDDAPVTYGNYTPKNYDQKYRGLITMRQALTNSVNIVAVKLFADADYVGISEGVKFAQNMNIDLQTTGPSMVLGGLTYGVKPLALTAAYAAFDNHGMYNDPVSILRVEDQDGTTLFEAERESRRVMKETTAYLITDMLKSVVQSGTGTGAQIGRPAAGKTGTTDAGRDIWFAGYTPNLVGVVWIGYDTPKRINSYGGVECARIWKEVMSQAHQGLPSKDFKQPPGIVSVTVDNKSGLRQGSYTPEEDLITDLFAAGTEPTEYDNVHVLGEVCATTGLLPNRYCPRITQVMLKLPYTVSPSVADYNQRVPTKMCKEHDKEYDDSQILPGWRDRPGLDDIDVDINLREKIKDLTDERQPRRGRL